MELDSIIELVKAGFSKDEIMQMAQTKTGTPVPEPVQMEMDLPAPEAEPAPVPAQVAEPVAVPAPVPPPIHEENQTTLNDILQSIAKLTSAVQANAIAQSVMPNSGVHAPTAEDMLAEIIRPTYGGKQ